MTGFNLGFTAIVLITIENNYRQGNPKYTSISSKNYQFYLNTLINMTGFDLNTTGIDWIDCYIYITCVIIYMTASILNMTLFVIGATMKTCKMSQTSQSAIVIKKKNCKVFK